MGFFKNMANKAAKAIYNDGKKTYQNGKAYYSYKMDQADRAKAERKQAETAVGGGYAYKGLFGTSAIERMHLNQNAKHYYDIGYSIMKVPVTLSNGKQGIRLYVKKSKAVKAVKAKVAKKVTGKPKTKKVTKAKSKAKSKAFTKTAVYSNKRYTLASVFYQYGDRAKAYASSLKQQGFSARVKTANVNGITNYAVYTRNPTRR